MSVGKSLTEAFLDAATFNTPDDETWMKAAPIPRSNKTGKNPNFEDKISCTGRQAPRTKAIPHAVLMRRAC